MGDPPVGFVCVELVDGAPHIWQLSVLPEHGRRGVGRALLQAACDWARAEGFATVTLTTYRDVPWSTPFYATLGFTALDTLRPGSRRSTSERAMGDDDFGTRLAMKLAL